MLIISKFHDYYDNITSFGIDKTVVYNRTTNEIIISKEIKRYFEELLWEFREVKLNTAIDYTLPLTNKKRFEIFYNLIGFCGKIYPLFLMKEFKEREEVRSEFGFETEDILNFIKNEGLEDRIKKKYYWDKGKRLIKSDLDYFFTKLKGKKIQDEIFFKLKCPVFYFEGPFFDYGYNLKESKIKINPNLAEIYFYKYIDSFTAFQEIYMYISGVLGTGQKETIEIKDKDMLIKKGFDSKSSFRHPVKTKDIK